MVNAWKIGVGSGATILGVYVLFTQKDIVSVIFGVIAIGFGIGLFASASR
jgi:multisubunit Na+/H+ antiporter MnhC subunit